MLSVIPAAVSVAMALLVAVAGYAEPNILLAALVLVVLGLAAGWGPLLDLPHPRGSGLVVAVTGLAALFAGRNAVAVSRPLAAFTGLMAFALLAAFVHELIRRDGREDLVESVTGTFTGQLVAVLGAGWLLLPVTRLGDHGVVLAGAAAAAAALVAAMPWPLRIGGWIALAVGGVVAAAAARSLLPLEAPRALAIGAGVAAVVVTVNRMLANQPAVRGAWPALSAGMAAVAAAGTAAYAAARLFVG